MIDRDCVPALLDAMEDLMKKLGKQTKKEQKKQTMQILKILENEKHWVVYESRPVPETVERVSVLLSVSCDYGQYCPDLFRKLENPSAYRNFFRRMAEAEDAGDSDTVRVLNALLSGDYTKERIQAVLQWMSDSLDPVPDLLLDPSFDDGQAAAIGCAWREIRTLQKNGYDPLPKITPQCGAWPTRALLTAMVPVQHAGMDPNRLSFLSPAWKSAPAIRMAGKLVLDMPDIPWENLLPENCPCAILKNLYEDASNGQIRDTAEAKAALARILEKWDGFTPALGQYYEDHTSLLDDTWARWQRDLRENSLSGDLLAVKLYADQKTGA